MPTVEVVQVILEQHRDLVNVTTGDGRTPLHVLALCDDGTDRMRTLDKLIAFSANLDVARLTLMLIFMLVLAHS